MKEDFWEAFWMLLATFIFVSVASTFIVFAGIIIIWALTVSIFLAIAITFGCIAMIAAVMAALTSVIK